MGVRLESLDDIDFQESERAILNVLRATLEFPADTTLKAEKLAHDIEFVCSTAKGEAQADGALWDVWSVIIELVSVIPSAHPWQDSLIKAVETLRQEGRAIPELSQTATWRDLPKLSLCVRENWGDPTFTQEDLPGEFEKWENFNSFIARLTTDDYQPWLHLTIHQLKIAFEEEATKGSPMNCRLWVATEWIIQCARIIFDDMNSTYTLDQGLARSYRTGPLAATVPPKSIDRWNFWKKRLSEISANSCDLELAEHTVPRITKALQAMADVDS